MQQIQSVFHHSLLLGTANVSAVFAFPVAHGAFVFLPPWAGGTLEDVLRRMLFFKGDTRLLKQLLLIFKGTL